MRSWIRYVATALAGGAILIWLGGSTAPQGRAETRTLSLDWVTGSGEVTYSDGAGCSCDRSKDGECSVQYDRHGRNIGSCDDTDTTCGDITGCPH